MFYFIKKRNFQTFCSALPLVGAEGTWKDEERQEGKKKRKEVKRSVEITEED